MKKIIIETLISSQKTAVLSNDKLDELLIEDNKDERIVSNIYRGVVKKVLPGIEACFVDIGFDKLGYLQLKKEDNIKSGQDILVQINKEGIGTKGAKLNQEISFAGRYLVYIPSNERVTISNKITDEKERLRLLKIAKTLNKEGLGLIIRTEAVGCSYDEIRKDIDELTKRYEILMKEYKLGIGPKLLYKDLDFASKYIRDNINEQTEQIIVNNKEKYDEIKSLIQSINIDYVSKLKLEEEDIFDIYKVENQIQKSLNKKVWLKSGGYLIIEKTEALTVIDINTGKFTGNSKLNETIYKTNLEAATEIPRQLKVRDIGGIVIIDFIDMHNKSYQREVLKTLEEELQKDKRRSEVLGMTKLGLVEMVRKRDKESIDKYYIKDIDNSNEEKKKTISYILDYIEKEIMRIKSHTSYKDVVIEMKKDDNEAIKCKYMDVIKRISQKYDINIEIKDNTNINNEKINIIYNS